MCYKLFLFPYRPAVLLIGFHQKRSMSTLNGRKAPSSIKQLKHDLAKGKIVQDGVHREIELHPMAVIIIDTYGFKRLKLINCLAEAHEVYPCGNHKRFEHSLGVYHLALRFALRLVETNLDLCSKVTYQDILCVALAGLLHDLGHGPMSHSFEVFLQQQGITFRHEGKSVELIDYLFTIQAVRDRALRYGLNLDDVPHNDIKFIQELINGPSDRTKYYYSTRPRSKFFLFEIVANKRTNIDVDRWDYFKRDSKACGVQIVFAYQRLLMNARVVELPAEEVGLKDDLQEPITCVAFPVKIIQPVWQLFETRRDLFTKIYHHRVVALTDQMKLDALASVVDDYTVFVAETNLSTGETIETQYYLTNAHTNIHAYMKLDDTIIADIRRRNGPNYKEARLLFNRVDERDLYHIVVRMTTRSDRDYFTVSKDPACGQQKSFMDEENTLVPEALRSEFMREMVEIIRFYLAEKSGSPEITAKDIKHIQQKLDYGGISNAEHPLTQVKFFRKNEPKVPISFSEDMAQAFCIPVPAAYVTIVDLFVIKPSMRAVSTETKHATGVALDEFWQRKCTREGAEFQQVGQLYHFDAPDKQPPAGLGSSQNPNGDTDMKSPEQSGYFGAGKRKRSDESLVDDVVENASQPSTTMTPEKVTVVEVNGA